MANTKVTGDLIAAATITATNIASGGLDSILSGYLTTNTYATESYVTTAVANLVDAAPSTLDTLNELAAALGDDPNFATTVTNALASKVDGTGTANYIPKFIDADTIGNSSASDNGTTFDVSIQGKFTSGSATRILTLNAPTDGGSLTFETGGTAYADMGSNKGILGTGSATDFYLGTRAGYSLALGTVNTARLFLDTSGNVGIGTSSPDLGAISGTRVLTIASPETERWGILELAGNRSWGGNQVGEIKFISTDATNNGTLVSLTAINDPTSTGTGGSLKFSTRPDGGSLTERMRITSAGNVLIGNTAAIGGQPLFVVNPTSAEAVMGIQSTSASGYSAIDLYNNSGSAKGAFGYGNASVAASVVQDSVYMYSTTDLRFLSGGLNERMRITSAGNVGIGTNSPQQNVHVHNGGTGSQIQFTDSNSGSGLSDGLRVGWNGTYGQVYLFENSYLRFGTNNTERMRIDSSGNVGIGTTDPIAALTSVNTGALTLNSNDSDHSGFGLFIGKPSLSANTVNTAIGFGNTTGRKLAAIGMQTYGDIDQTGLNFYVQPTSSGSVATLTEAMRIDNNGKVGINQTPTAQLDVNSGFTNTVAAFRSTDSGAYIGIADPSTTLDAGYPTLSIGAVGNNLTLSTSNAERMRITSGGRVLIGTTTPSVGASNFGPTSLHVNDEIVSKGPYAGFFFENRSGGVTIASNWYGWYNVGGVTYFYNGAGNIASINSSTGTYTALSDKNKKKDFEDSNIGLDEVLQLKPTLYRMLSDNNLAEKELGFIAQDVKKVIPQAYIEETSVDASNIESTFIGLKDRPILAATVKAIQELKEIVDNQQRQINDLKAQLNG